MKWLYCQFFPTKFFIIDAIKKDLLIKRRRKHVWAEAKFKTVTKHLTWLWQAKRPLLCSSGYVISCWKLKVRWGKNTALFTLRLCHWDIMGPAWPKALFWFPSNGEENGSQRKVSVSMRCSPVWLRNAKNNTAGLVLRTWRGNYKLKALDLRTFPGI